MKPHETLTHDELFNRYVLQNPLARILPEYRTTQSLAQAFAALGYGVATEQGFTFTTPFTPSRVELQTLGGLPTPSQYARFKGLGWPYKARKIFVAVTHTLAALGLLWSALIVQRAFCLKIPSCPYVCQTPNQGVLK